MSQVVPRRNENTLSRRELLALAATGLASSWGQPATCRALGDEPRGREEPSRSGRILAIVRNLARTEQNPEGISGFVTIDPENGAWTRICDDASSGSLSPDGKTLAISVFQPSASDTLELGLWTRDMEGANPPKRIADIAGYPVWSPDGKQIIMSAWRGPIRDQNLETWRMDADGSNRVNLSLDDNDRVLDWSRDGQWLAVLKINPQGGNTTLRLIHPDRTGQRQLIEGENLYIVPRFSPDGRQLLCVKRTIVANRRLLTVWLVELDGETRRQIGLELKPSEGGAALWSPDGKRLAVGVADPDGVDSLQIKIGDADGKDWHALPLPPGRAFLLDWR